MRSHIDILDTNYREVFSRLGRFQCDGKGVLKDINLGSTGCNNFPSVRYQKIETSFWDISAGCRDANSLETLVLMPSIDPLYTI